MECPAFLCPGGWVRYQKGDMKRTPKKKPDAKIIVSNIIKFPDPNEGPYEKCEDIALSVLPMLEAMLALDSRLRVLEGGRS